jgi:hypothetical protein
MVYSYGHRSRIDSVDEKYTIKGNENSGDQKEREIQYTNSR